MGSRRVRAWLTLAVLLTLPVLALAQEAAISGTVSDSTGGVLPGVTVTAVHEASGNSFVAMTDARGQFRLPVRVGGYHITGELQGFASVTRTGLEILVGQQMVVNLQMAPSTVQETVTVTGEAPLIDATRSTLGVNIDPRQVSEIPLNGRNWIDLTVLAPGSRRNTLSDEPAAGGAFQLNVDGQQVTQTLTFGFGQPRFSRDAIAEFQFVVNRFDATQGRSSGVQVNAVTKAGTNVFAGTGAGYFRSDRFNAADFIQDRVLPYSNQQLSFTFGGPVRRDKIHFFANYEFEREPQTFTFDTPWPSFNIDLEEGARRSHTGGVRVDVQFTPQTRLTARSALWDQSLPYDPRFTGGAIRHPSGGIANTRETSSYTATFTQVLGNRAVNELRGGYSDYFGGQSSIVAWPNHPQAAAGVTHGAPSIVLRGITIGQNHTQTPQELGQQNYFARDDFTFSYSKQGNHTLKAGGEYVYSFYDLFVCRVCMGILDAQGGAPPANLEALFPVWNDISTWNLAALSSITRRYTIGVGNFNFEVPRHQFAGWVQDDWTLTSRLTLNLGLRYDVATGLFAEDVELRPWLERGRPIDTDNIAARLGFAYGLTDRTVVRGGFGKFFAEVSDQSAHGTLSWTQIVSMEVLNDGRPNFAANPFNGPRPTYEQALQRLCTTAPGPNCLRPTIQNNLAWDQAEVPYSYQTSIGLQRQIGNLASFEADYVFTGTRHDFVSRNANLTYNPATGANYPFTDVSRRLHPAWGTVSQQQTIARSNYHGLQTAFTKRFSQGWQASGTYTLSRLGSAEDLPPVSFPLAPDFGGEYTLAEGDQRHRAVLNGIWEIGYGFQLSGLYFFGSGERFSTTYGGDLRGQGANASGRLRPDGTIVERNNFVGRPVHRVDTRIQRRFALGGGAAAHGLIEVFNLFNHENYGSYVTQESNARHGQPSANTNIAFAPRMLQLGVRLEF